MRQCVAEPAPSLHEQKRDLRDLHRLLVGSVARNSSIDHRRFNAELIARTGSRVDQATVEQLQKRINCWSGGKSGDMMGNGSHYGSGSIVPGGEIDLT